MPRRKRRLSSGVEPAPPPPANALVLSIPRGASVAFLGSVRARILAGSATVLGAVIAPSADARAMHSPAGGAVLAFDASDKRELQVLLERFTLEDQGSCLAPARAEHDLSSLPHASARATADELGAALETHVGIRLVMHAAVPAGMGALLPPEWLTASTAVLASLRQRPTVLVCGPRNTGKSSFFRFMCNRALEDWETVCVLDCDVGQPELSPPGLVSLHALHGPLLGPPYAHERSARVALASVFIGEASPASDPRFFMCAIQRLAEAHRGSEYAASPLLVNTCGWVRGLGLALLAEIVQAVRPSQLVQLCPTRTGSRTGGGRVGAGGLDGEESAAGQCQSRARDEGGEGLDLSELGIGESFGLTPTCLALPSLESSSAAAMALSALSHVSAPDLRTWQLMSYFADTPSVSLGKCTPQDGSGRVGTQVWRSPQTWRHISAALTSAPVAIVPLSAVRIALSTSHVPASELLWSLNASLVALCVDERKDLVPVLLDARFSSLDVPRAQPAEALPTEHGVLDGQLALVDDPPPLPLASSSAEEPRTAEGGQGTLALCVLSEPPLCECVGLGIVRAIDVARGELHILTPVPIERLQRVNTIVRGSIQLPSAMVVGGAQPMGAMPYFTAESVTDAGAGASSMRSRNNLVRATTQGRR